MDQRNEQIFLENAANALLSDNGKWFRKLYIGAICIFAAVIPLVVAAGVWVWMSISESRRELSNFLVVRAVQVKNDVDAWIKEEYEVLVAIGSTLRIEPDNLTATRKTLQIVKGEVSRWKAIYLYDAETGRLAEDKATGASPETPPDVMQAMREVIDTKRPALCTCLISGDKQSPGYGIHLFAPVWDKGEVHYVLSVVLKYDTIQRMMVTAAAPFYDVGILDENDIIIARTSRNDDFRGQLPSEDFRLHAKGESRTVGTFTGRTYTGNQATAAFARSLLTGWTIVTATGADNVDALAQQSQWAFFAITGLCLILVAVLAIMILYNMMLRRVSTERMMASRALSDLQSRLLTTTNDALKEQSKAASEREVLLREIYHRVKNNLQIIQSLMRLGARGLSPEQQEPFEAAVRRIGAMARVHTLLYNSPDLASIDFKEYISSIVAEISESFGATTRGIKTRLDVQSIPVPLDAAIPLAFISVELLANAFKHAFLDGRDGEVTIRAHAEGNNGILIISDNGIGMPEPGRRKKSLGLNLVGRLIEQIGGTVQMPEVGQSEYRITFPLSERKMPSAG